MFEETHNLQRKMSGFLASFSCKMCHSGELDRSGTVRAAPCAVTLRVQSMLQPVCSAQDQIANFFRSYPERFDR